MRIIAIIGLLFFYGVISLVGLGEYILKSLGLYTLATRRQVSKPWLAWIPVVSWWLVGALADDYDGKRGIKRNWRTLLFTLSLLLVVLFVVSYIALVLMTLSKLGEITLAAQTEFMLDLMWMFCCTGIVFVSIASTVCNAICIFKIFESTQPEKAVKYLLLDLVVPLAGAICLMLCRNKGYEASESNIQLVPTVAFEPEKEEN